MSSTCAAPAAPPCALAPERSAVAAPWPDAWAPAAGWLWADAVGARSAAATASQSPPERCRISIAMISSWVGAGTRPVRRAFLRPKILSPGIVSLAARAVNCRWTATRTVGHGWPGENHAAGSTWNTARRSSSRRSTWNLGERAGGSKEAAGSGLGSMTLTEITVTRWRCMEARGEDGSGEALRGVILPILGKLIRISDSEGVNLGRQAHLRVIRDVVPPSRSVQGLTLRLPAWRPRGAVVSSGLSSSLRPSQVMAPARSHEPR